MRSKVWRVGGDKRPQQKGLSLEQDPEADRRAAPRLHVHTRLARATGRRKSTQARLHRAVRRAKGGAGQHSGCQLRRCKPSARSSAKKLATKIAGAKALERALRGGCGCEERKAACTRHGERLRPDRGRTPGWDVGQGEGGGKRQAEGQGMTLLRRGG